MSSLFLISLPIGNLGDLTPRAKGLLETQTFFLAEDTRKFFDFMQRAGISREGKKASAFHDHTQGEDLNYWISRMNHGEDLYMVSDAGSPIVSDPAFPLVRAALDAGHQVRSVPGVSAVTVALELSGLPPHPFYFYGFLSREKEKRRNFLQSCLANKGTHIFFESPQRVEESLEDLASVAPNVQVAVARELTKTYEEVYRFMASDFPTLKTQLTYKGEFVILFHNKEGQSLSSPSKARDLVTEYLEGKAGPKLLAKIFAEITGESSKDIYQQLVSNR